MPSGLVVQKGNSFFSDGIRIIEGHKRAALAVQQLDGVQIRRRNDGFAGAQGIGKRAGNDLSLMLVRCDVNVRRADQFNQVFRALETVAKDHIGFNAEIFCQGLQVQPVFLTFAPQDMRVSYTGNHVYNIHVTRQDFWQGFYDIFYSLIGREQAKGQQNALPLRSEAILVEIGIRERQIGDAMGNQIDLFDWHLEYFLQNLCRVLAHDDQAVRKCRNFLHHRALVGSWIAKHGMQSGYERHPQVPQQLQDVAASQSPKYSVFVLQAD